MKARLLLLSLLLLNAACGFHLRGSQTTNFDVTNIYIQSAGAPRLEKQVKAQLVSAGVGVANSIETASYIVDLNAERFERSVLSVSADTGKVEEFQIVYQATMNAAHIDGTNIARGDNIRVVRDLTFDEEAVLGKFSEEALIQEDMVRTAASQVLRRLQALITKSN